MLLRSAPMRATAALALASLAGLGSCKSTAPGSTASTTASSTATIAPSPAPAASASATGTSALEQSKGLPPWTFAGFPGWIGYATNPERSAEDSPRHATHAIAIGDEPAWAETKAALRAHAPGFSEVVPFAAYEEIGFGCDGRTASFAFWSASKRLTPGPLWLTPPETSATVTPVVEIPKEKIPAKVASTGEPELRAWSAGAHTFVSRRTGTTLVSEVWEGETRTFRDASKYVAMEGADDVAPSLEGGPGVPIPRLVIAVEGKTLLLVESNGFEGAGFVGVLLEKGAAKRAEGRPYSYWCAF